ncbi:DUF3634 family protein [Haloferula chungangensis]|uniref:DUF3634 family protein n=1 Tax=Haloferula chungangensis TaxID=1048331 RepID=A0ABW2LBC5_9BACT
MLWLDKLLHPTVLIIEDGTLRAAKGKLSSKTLRDLQSISSDHKIARGSLSIDGAGRVHFYKEVPEDAHQSIRNILINL